MDNWVKEAYRAAEQALAETESQQTGERYRISGIDLNSMFVNRFTSKIVAHPDGDVYEHRIRPVVLEKKGLTCVIQLPEVDQKAGGTTSSRAAYETFLTAINNRQGLCGHGGTVTAYEE